MGSARHTKIFETEDLNGTSIDIIKKGGVMMLSLIHTQPVSVCQIRPRRRPSKAHALCVP